MIYTHVLNKGGHGVRSPFDGLWAGLYRLYKPGSSVVKDGGKHLK